MASSNGSVLNANSQGDFLFPISTEQIEAAKVLRNCLHPSRKRTPGGMRIVDLESMCLQWTLHGLNGSSSKSICVHFMMLVAEDTIKYATSRSSSGRNESHPRHGHSSSQSRHTSDIETWPEESSITKYFNLFDDVFFFGSLKGKVKFNIYTKDHSDYMGGVLGYTQEDKNSLQRGAIIALYDSHDFDFPQRLGRVLGTLLHEMVHAFLSDTIDCKCQECKGNSRFYVGETGHGVSFLGVFHNIAQSAHLKNWNGMLKLYGTELDMELNPSRCIESKEQYRRLNPANRFDDYTAYKIVMKISHLRPKYPEWMVNEEKAMRKASQQAQTQGRRHSCRSGPVHSKSQLSGGPSPGPVRTRARRFRPY